jgi:flagellar M-ring protein FliF
MATSEATLSSGFIQSSKSAMGGKLLLILGIATIVALMSVVWLWSRQPDYRILFSNYSDKDGGAIVAALEQMNVPYKFSDGGSAILVPAAQVHEMRLKLASQGLPKGGNVGFELLENQKFGVSQFVEQVNFQRALEGELERSIQSVDAVQVARIHLAIPKASVFVHDQLKPTASVLLNLHPGRKLDPQQVSAIVHLVASSVPELDAANVTIVDQNGNLLSDTSKQNGPNNPDPTKLKYVEELQQNIVKRVESIITPLVGANNVRAEANAEVDFSTSEQAAESYKPNQAADAATIRSSQTSESLSSTGGNSASGVPGALSNQPPTPATAPIVANGSATQPVNGTAGSVPVNSQKNVTNNFEVDKTVRYIQQPMGGIKRLSVAVVVNYKSEIDKSGKTINRPLTDAEKTQISDLAKQAMGFKSDRGDTLSVVNSSFAGTEREVVPELPMWKQPDNIELAKEFAKFGVGILVIFLLYIRMLKPMLRTLTTLQPSPALLPKHNDDGSVVRLNGNRRSRGYEQNLEETKQLAKENPKLVANLVTTWVSGND